MPRGARRPGFTTERKLSMKRPGLALLLLLLWVTAASAAPEIRTARLSNGLRVVMAPDPSAAGVDVSVWFDAGTRYERDGASGMAYLLERLYQRAAGGAAGDPRAVAAAAGGSGGSYTAADVTCFHSTVVAEALDDVLGAEAARMRAPTVSAGAVAAERDLAALMRRQRLESSTAGQGLELLYATAWSRHPYRRPVLGTDFARLELDACRSWLRDRYAPGRAVLTLVGRFDPDSALASVRRQFESIPRGPAERATPAAEPAQTAERRAWRRVDAGPAMLLVGWRAKGVGEPDIAALDVIARALVTGPEARLQRALMRESGFGLAVHGALDGRRDASLLHVLAVVRAEADSAEVERLIGEHAAALASAPMEEAEFERLRRQTEVALLGEWESVRGRGQVIGGAAAVAGDPAAAWNRIEALRRLTREDVHGVAARVLVPSARTTVWMRPPAAAGGGEGGRP
jgi:zinc protease